jgi:ferredoxin
MGLRIVVDFELCEANARCMQVAPAVFRVGDDDLLTVLIERPGPELEEAVGTAAGLCPRQAITLVEEP